MASNNILSPSNGRPIIDPSQDVVLGIYYMTREKINAKGEGSIFADVKEVSRAFETGAVELQAKVKVRIKDREGQTELKDTTVGRALLYQISPDGLNFEHFNKTLTSKGISDLINTCYRDCGLKDTVIFADQLMYQGYEYSTKSGSSICVDDCLIPEDKAEIIEKSEQELSLIHI